TRFYASGAAQFCSIRSATRPRLEIFDGGVTRFSSDDGDVILTLNAGSAAVFGSNCILYGNGAGLTNTPVAFPSGAALTNVLMTNIVLDFPSTVAGASADVLVPFSFPKSNDLASVSAPAACMQNNSSFG